MIRPLLRSFALELESKLHTKRRNSFFISPQPQFACLHLVSSGQYSPAAVRGLRRASRRRHSRANRIPHDGYADDLTFNYYSILSAVAGGATFEFFPLSWREEDQVSNVKVARQAWKMVKILASFAASRRRFVRKRHAANMGEYSALILHETRPRTAGAA